MFAKLLTWQNKYCTSNIFKWTQALQVFISATVVQIETETSHLLLQKKIYISACNFFFTLHCFLVWGQHFVARVPVFVVFCRELTSQWKKIPKQIKSYCFCMTQTSVWVLRIFDLLIFVTLSCGKLSSIGSQTNYLARALIYPTKALVWIVLNEWDGRTHAGWNLHHLCPMM